MYRSRPGSGFKAPRFVNEGLKVEPVAEVEKVEVKTVVLNKVRRVEVPASSGNDLDEIYKRRKLLLSKKASTPLHRPATSTANPLPPKSLPTVDQPTKVKTENPPVRTDEKYLVQWRKRSTKKNKTWEGDGSLMTSIQPDGSISLFFKDVGGKLQSKRSVVYNKNLLEDVISMGQFELQIDCKVSEQNAQTETQFKKVTNTVVEKHPLYENSDSLVLPRPNVPDSKIIDVRVDPMLSSKLRPHQVEGVIFIYECVMGMRDYIGNGCLLADEMGLGKTLMTITIIWTLLKQNPFKNQPKPVISRVLIVCPVTLINNWKKEFEKWLGIKVHVLTLNGTSSGSSITDKVNIINFGKLHVYNVLIINYEKVTTFNKELENVNFDLLICDEGHRLKSSSNKVLGHLTRFDIPRKILLTGTPIQNDLVEFFTIINFLNPGIVGDYKSFQKQYINPILRSRDIACFDVGVKKVGEAISNKLITTTKKFVLRRTQSILLKYLTSKTDIILFAPPTSVQIKLFRRIVSLKAVSEVMTDLSSNHVFALINLFKKLCNSPSLLVHDDYYQRLIRDSTQLTDIPLPASSGKIKVLIPLLLEITSLGEKVVLVSNYTKTLDLLETILQKLNLSFLRLDGATPKNMRNKLVDDFNRANSKRIPVFLLSSKSGGMGINLIGASRLVLFDNDWNPATDLQSMSRIHRDGQKRDCFIYRIFTTGCIDEKIFQRQLMKTNLSMKFLDNSLRSKTDEFDQDDLRNLFEITHDTISNTHDLLGCECKGNGDNIAPDIDIDTDEDSESEETSKQNSWISASDLKEKLDKNEIKLNGAIKLVLNDYKHILPKRDAIHLHDHLNDKVLLNMINNKSFGDSLPLSYIMTKVAKIDDIPEVEEMESDEVGDAEQIEKVIELTTE